MEAKLNFRTKINNSNAMLQNISLLKNEKTASDEHARNNNTFFNALDEYVRAANSFVTMCKVIDVNELSECKDDLIDLSKSIKETFETKVVKSPIVFQKKVKNTSENLSNIWYEYSQKLIEDVVDQLEIFYVVCNKKEIKEIISGVKSIKQWPITEDVYNKFLDDFTRAKDKIKEIHFDDEIEAFLRKIKDKTATLLDLNDKILTWIKDNNLNGNIMLSIKPMFLFL